MKHDTVNIGVCWYKEEQWERLKEIVVDPENIEETMPIRLAQVVALGYDPAHVKLPSESVGVSASLP